MLGFSPPSHHLFPSPLVLAHPLRMPKALMHPPYHKLEESLVFISQKFLIEDAEDLGRSRGGCLSWCSCSPPETGTPWAGYTPLRCPGGCTQGLAPWVAQRLPRSAWLCKCAFKMCFNPVVLEAVTQMQRAGRCPVIPVARASSGGHQLLNDCSARQTHGDAPLHWPGVSRSLLPAAQADL